MRVVCANVKYSSRFQWHSGSKECILHFFFICHGCAECFPASSYRAFLLFPVSIFISTPPQIVWVHASCFTMELCRRLVSVFLLVYVSATLSIQVWLWALKLVHWCYLMQASAAIPEDWFYCCKLSIFFSKPFSLCASSWFVQVVSGRELHAFLFNDFFLLTKPAAPNPFAKAFGSEQEEKFVMYRQVRSCE